MKKLSYSDKLKDPRWQKVRLEIFKRDKFKCQLCGDPSTTLCVHHEGYIAKLEPWEYDFVSLTTLCEHCHTEVEGLKDDSIKNICTSWVKIFKNNFTNGSRAMWILFDGKVHYKFYDCDGELCQHSLYSSHDTALKKLRRFLNKAINGV